MTKEFRLPELGENIHAGTVGKVLVKPGDVIAAGQNVIEIETDKAVAEIPATVSGRVTEIRVKEGGTVHVGDVVLVVDESADMSAPAGPPTPAPAPTVAAAAPAPPAEEAVEPATRAVAHPGAVRAAPSVRRMARELGVDLNDVPSLDPAGRVTAQDLLAYRHAAAAPSPAASTAPGPPPVPVTEALETVKDKWGGVLVQPMNNVRGKTAERMAENWATIPHVTHFDKADITSLEELRVRAAKKVEAAGGRLTITSFLLKALPEALRRFPKFNASVDMKERRLLLRQYYNIGVAVDTPNGLLVPVLRDVDRKSVTQLSVELPELAKKARDRKLTLEDMQGGTFTVSNLGGLGGTGFTPIINAPEVAILGMSRAKFEPVWANGQFAPRLMLPLSLSYDHRIIDGADAARFLRWLVEAVEQPWKLFLED